MKRVGLTIAGTVVVCAISLIALPASGDVVTIDFNDYPAGTTIDEQWADQGVHFSAIDSDTNTLTLYDSTGTGGADDDLEGPPNDDWDGGNLAPDTQLDELIIIADNITDSNNDGLIDSPNDDAGGGTIVVEFDFDLYSFGLSGVDTEEQTETYNLQFYRDGTLIGQVFFDNYTTPGDYFYDSTVEYGNNYANRFDPVTHTTPNTNVVGGVSDPANGDGNPIGYFDEIHIVMSGSGGWDDFEYEQTPEPASLGLFSLGIIGLATLRRRRRSA